MRKEEGHCRSRRGTRIKSESGVTLIELLVVVTIIALFAALVGPRLFKHVGKARGLRLIWILDLPELFRIAFWVSLKSRSDQW